MGRVFDFQTRRRTPTGACSRCHQVRALVHATRKLCVRCLGTLNDIRWRAGIRPIRPDATRTAGTRKK